MSNPPSQPAFHPDISAFVAWVDSNSVRALGPTSAIGRPFMPQARLDRHLKDNNRTRTLLRALFPNRNPPIGPEEIWRNSVRVFSILLLIGKAHFIEHFIQHAQLSDSKLPFHPLSHFPPTPGGDGFVDAFVKEQWRFCPHTFSRDQIGVHLEKESVLPIISKEQLGHGGSSFTYKIELHPDYDRLVNPQDARRRYAHIYVLKTYRFKDAKEQYEIEVGAFRALRGRGCLGKSIIDFYGSFEQDESYNVLLEYADRGNLEQYLEATPPPTTGEEIHTFWNAFFNIIKAVKVIHNVKGGGPSDPPILKGHVLDLWPFDTMFHQDIQPSNILVMSNMSESRFDCRFILADLGLSHFRKVQRSRTPAFDKDTSGTREYGAPECYRSDESMEGSHIDVDQAVDIWSLGSVLSEVAVWVVHGKDGLDTYRRRRQEETDNLPNFKDGRAFHNGREVLQSVCQTLEEVSENVRTSDHITRSVVQRMVTEMLYEADSRPNSISLWTKSQKILDYANKKFRPPKEDPQGTIVPLYQRREPPIPPPGLTQTQRHSSGRSGAPNRLPSSEHDKTDAAGPVRTPSPKWSADMECQTPEPMLSPASTPPTSPPDVHLRTHTESQDPFERGGTYYHTPIRQSAPTYGSNWLSSPTEHRKDHQRHTINSSNYELDSSPNQILAHSISGWNLGELDGRPDTRQAAEPPTRKVDADELHSQPIEKEATNLSTPLPPLQNGAVRRPPSTSIAKAENWILKKQNKDTFKALEHSEYLGDLKQRDHVFLVDDAASMSPYWEDVCSVLHVLAYVLKDCDDDGMDLYFTISQKRYNYKSSKDVVQKVRRQERKGTSDIGLRLGLILREFQGSLLQPQGQQERWPFFRKSKAKGKKPLNVYILTDAVWQPHSDVAQPVSSLVGTLKRLDLPANYVGIQFVHFGKHPEGIQKLAHLDQHLGLPMDIVDAEPADGNLWKMLLGSINKWFDQDEEDIRVTPNH